MSIQDVHAKHLANQRSWLHGRGYFKALEAMETARRFHDGVRKDKETPEFHHQVSIVKYLITLEPHLLFPEDTFAVAYLHDLVEDHSKEVSFDTVQEQFGKEIAQGVRFVTKKYEGVVIPPALYFRLLEEHPVASIVKAVDRAHNVQTMPGVFGSDKQKAYLDEVEERYFPMMKAARRLFPQQLMAYENVKWLLKSQTALIRHMLESA